MPFWFIDFDHRETVDFCFLVDSLCSTISRHFLVDRSIVFQQWWKRSFKFIWRSFFSPEQKESMAHVRPSTNTVQTQPMNNNPFLNFHEDWTVPFCDCGNDIPQCSFNIHCDLSEKYRRADFSLLFQAALHFFVGIASCVHWLKKSKNPRFRVAACLIH